MDTQSTLFTLISVTVLLVIMSAVGFWLHLRLVRMEKVQWITSMLASSKQCCASSTESQPEAVETVTLEVSEPEPEPEKAPEQAPEAAKEQAPEAAKEEEEAEKEEEEAEIDDRLSIPESVEETLVEQAIELPTTSTFDDMTVPQLKDLCRERGIKVHQKDRKGDLVARLSSISA
jgi:cytoskeletal protein RodZ